MASSELASFSDIVVFLGSDKEVAAGVGAKEHQPRDWRIRNGIPSEWWDAVVAFAKKIGRKGITLRLLSSLAEQKRIAAEDQNQKSSRAAA